MSISFGLIAFQYPQKPHVRRHWPMGYTDYKSYKPWLRDEFTFRCVYCLTRERWYPNGQDSFGIDHLMPKSARRDLLCDYGNLLYVCNRCNSAKRISKVLDPCAIALGIHLRIVEDGTAIAHTREGEHLIDVFNLNYPLTKTYRQRKIAAFQRWREMGDDFIIEEELAFPDELPNLRQQRCKNARPQGIAESYFEKRAAGKLPPTFE